MDNRINLNEKFYICKDSLQDLNIESEEIRYIDMLNSLYVDKGYVSYATINYSIVPMPLCNEKCCLKADFTLNDKKYSIKSDLDLYTMEYIGKILLKTIEENDYSIYEKQMTIMKNRLKEKIIDFFCNKNLFILMNYEMNNIGCILDKNNNKISSIENLKIKLQTDGSIYIMLDGCINFTSKNLGDILNNDNFFIKYKINDKKQLNIKILFEPDVEIKDIGLNNIILRIYGPTAEYFMNSAMSISDNEYFKNEFIKIDINNLSEDDYEKLYNSRIKYFNIKKSNINSLEDDIMLLLDDF